MFHSMLGTMVVWVQSPVPACHTFQFTEDVFEFLLHPDGAALPIPPDELLANLNDPDAWAKNADGMEFMWSISLGFLSLFLFRTTPCPTLLQQSLFGAKCHWCNDYHDGGPEGCEK